jgi:Flp pilus assembly protein TadG
MKRPAFVVRNQRRGATAVEMAFVLPVLLLLLFGAYELGRANMMMHTCEAAAYEGARTGIIPGATAAECVAAAQRVLATAGVSRATIDVLPNNLADDTDTVAVSIEIKFAENTIIAPIFMGDGAILRKCEMTREQL